MKELPEKYQLEMKALLQDEYDDYVSSMNDPACHGLRVNTDKISIEEFRKNFPYHLEPVPWTEDGFYYNPDDPVSKHPYYSAGLFYIQEPSAMLPAEVMPASPDDRILDICAAPGGKSTKLGVKLHGTGLLFSNDISVSRAQALLKNLEKFGIRNAFVLAENPAKLESVFPHYFNRILIDAPCSGEGMFRKDPALMKAWEKHDSAWYVPVQKQIFSSAVKMLKEGGTIVYSTCTFARAEDEDMVAYALSLDPSLSVVKLPYQNGFIQNAYGTKLFPHRVHGEGHFVSVLQKGNYAVNEKSDGNKDVYEADGFHVSLANGSFQEFNEKLYYVPDTDCQLHGLRMLRSGLYIGDNKKKRLHYSEAFALGMKPSECEQHICFSADDPRIKKYLRGETLDISDYPYQNGWVLICVENYPLGFARMSHGVFKNMLPKGWIQL